MCGALPVSSGCRSGARSGAPQARGGAPRLTVTSRLALCASALPQLPHARAPRHFPRTLVSSAGRIGAWPLLVGYALPGCACDARPPHTRAVHHARRMLCGRCSSPFPPPPPPFSTRAHDPCCRTCYCMCFASSTRTQKSNMEAVPVSLSSVASVAPLFPGSEKGTTCVCAARALPHAPALLCMASRPPGWCLCVHGA